MPGYRLSARIHRFGTSPRPSRTGLHLAAALLLAALGGGCATIAPDGGMALVNGIVAPELKSEVAKVNDEDVAGKAHVRTMQLLSATLSADGAVGVALLIARDYRRLITSSVSPKPRWSK